jgi:hypothetical protein
MKVGLVTRPVGMVGHRLRVSANRAPEVGEQPVGVVDRLELGGMGPLQQDRAGTEERLDIVRDIAERFPHLRRDGGLAAEPRERSVHTHLR